MAPLAPLALSADELTRALFPTRPLQLFTTSTIPLYKLTEANIQLLTASCSGILGISAIFGKQKRLTSLVLASSRTVLHITNFNPTPAQRRLLERTLFCNSALKLVGFPMDAIAYGLHLDAGLLLSNGVDLQSLCGNLEHRKDVLVFSEVMGDEHRVERTYLLRMLKASSLDPSSWISAVVRARESHIACLRPSLDPQLKTAPLVSTAALESKVLDVLSKLYRDSAMLDALKPIVQSNDVVGKAVYHKGVLRVELGRYKTRIRDNTDQTLIVDVTGGGKLKGRARKVSGRKATVSLTGSAPGRTFEVSVTTVGKDPLTNAEKLKEVTLLSVLQGSFCVEHNLVFRAIWFPSQSPSRSLAVSPLVATTMDLNVSQTKAVSTVVSTLHSSSVDVHTIRGPPGTGKTTVIAACVQEFRAMGQSAWLVAQSNVAVKNIAEKLARIGFLEFKILVSKEFHHDWHEGLYEKLEQNMIRSDEFPKTLLGVERRLAGSKILLCTLSMLSNPSLHLCGFPRVVPIETLVVDEASQIELGDYMPAVRLFGTTLRRLVFVGDDKQLAPYGQEQIPKLRSIFEVPIHQARAVMLDVCYRLPVPICNFISKHVYNGELKSYHDVNHRSSCRFVNVLDGTETKKETSWTNEREADVCISLAHKLHAARRSYRIITPYDSQRNLIETKLKGSGLRWEDRVFCVDSFQGNEDDYIVISVVRTTKPGFMTNLRRTNVMLTRCKKGMYVCANKAFLTSAAARDTLIGKMAIEWGQRGWMTTQDVYNGRI